MIFDENSAFEAWYWGRNSRARHRIGCKLDTKDLIIDDSEKSIYHNLIINNVMVTTIRYIEPVATDQVEVTAWHLVPREESEAMRSIRSDSFLSFLGPGGFATPDDVEALESCQAGLAAREVEWSDISRGMLRPVPHGTDELQLRAFWWQWHGHLMGLDRVETADRLPAYAGI